MTTFFRMRVAILSGVFTCSIRACDRANSDSDLTHLSAQVRSSLTVDKTQVILGHGQIIKVTWNIREAVSASDWLGLFAAGNVA